MSTTPIDVFEVTTPSRNDAASWNDAIKEGAQKAGVDLTKANDPAAAAAAAAAKKEDDQPTVYKATLNVNGTDMEFTGKDAADVLGKYSAAVEAARLAAAPVPKEEEKKPAISEAEMFDIQTGLMKGDPTVLNNYILKSGLVKQYLESEGISLEQLKAATTANQNNQVHDAWKTASDAFEAKVKGGEIDWPGGEQNMKMLGLIMAKNGAKPTVESFVAAYDEMKKSGMVFPVTTSTKKEEPPAQQKKQAASSTAVGASSGTEERKAVVDPNRRFEIDMTKLTPRQYADAYNKLINEGVKPEQITVKQ